MPGRPAPSHFDAGGPCSFLIADLLALYQINAPNSLHRDVEDCRRTPSFFFVGLASYFRLAISTDWIYLIFILAAFQE